MPPFTSQWYCGWCKNGPMNVRVSERCLYCHRYRDGYSTYATQSVQPRTDISREYVDELHTTPFKPTITHHTIECADGTGTDPLINIEVSKGFFQAEAGVWTTYRRNYFSVTCLLRVGRTQSLPYYIKTRTYGPSVKVSRFHLVLSARSDSGDPVHLQRHTLKAENATLPSTEDPLTFSTAIDPSSPSTQWKAEFGRMQFRKATVNDTKSRAPQQYFHLIITLLAEPSPGAESHMVVASRTSFPLIVRGRSRGHYAEDGRDTSTRKPWEDKSAEPSMQIPLNRKDEVLETRPTKWDPSSKSNTNQGYTDYPASIGNALVEGDAESGPKQGQELQTRVEPENYAKDRVEVGLPWTDMSDNSSISSVGYSSRSVLSSKSSVAAPDNNSHKLVDLLLGDTGFRALCKDGFRYLESDRFERNLLRLFKIFFKSIKVVRSSQLNQVFLQYRGRARNIASTIRSKIAAEDAAKTHELKALPATQVDKEQLINKYLSHTRVGYESSSQTLDDGQNREMQLEAESASSSSDQLSDEEAEPRPMTLSQSVEETILKSEAWEELREGLMGFVVPILVANHHEQYHQNVVAGASQHGVAEQGMPPNTEQVHRADPGFSGTPGQVLPLLATVRDAQAACQALMTEPLFSQDSMARSKHELAAFGQSLHQIEGCAQSNEPRSPWVEQAALSLTNDAMAILGALESRLTNVYTRCLQERYQQSRTLETTDGPTFPFQLMVKNIQTEDHLLCLNLAISLGQRNGTHNDLVDIQALTQQLPTQRLSAIAASFNFRLTRSDTNKIVEASLAYSIAWLLQFKATMTRFLYTRAPAVLNTLATWWHTRARPTLLPNQQRVEWTCDCGETLWGDFQIESSELATNLAQWLECPANEHTTNRNLPQLTGGSSSQPTAHAQNPPPSTSQTLCSAPSVSASASSTSRPYTTSMTERYLELCINTGEYDVTLAEIQITTPTTLITSDGQLFEEIKKRYHECRGFLRTHRWSLLKPTEVHFVRFCLEDGDVGILQAPLSLPSDQDIQSRSWEYCPCPCPLKEPPPIPTNVFLHHLNSTRAHPRSTWLNLLPKKLHNSIHQRGEGPHVGWQATGWGVHIIEGPNERAVLALHVLLIGVSLVGAIAWSVWKNDVQGGFGIAGFAVAATSVLVWAWMGYGIGTQKQMIKTG